MRAFWLLALAAVVLSACLSPVRPVVAPDGSAGPPDASVSGPDASANVPDASIGAADASVGAPDGSIGAPDASVNAAVTYAEFSPDGSRLAYLVGEDPDVDPGTLDLYDIPAGTSVEIATGVPERNLQFSANGNSLAYLDDAWDDRYGTLELYTTSTGTSAQIPMEYAVDGFDFESRPNFGFSPDGSRLAYLTGGTLMLKTLSTGASTQVATGVNRYEFSPDGSLIPLITDCTSAPGPLSCTLELYTVSTGAATQVATPHDAWFGPFSPDGNWLPYFMDEDMDLDTGTVSGTLALYEISTGATVQVATAVTDYEFSPDSSLLAYVTGGTLMLKTLSTGASTQVAGVSHFGFSPDGSRLAYVTGVTLMLKTLSTGPSTQVATGVTVDWFSPYWFSPDGSLLAYLVREDPPGDGTLDLYTVSTGALRQVATNVDALNVGFSPDGSRLAYTTYLGYGIYGDNETFPAEALQLYAVSTHSSVQLPSGFVVGIPFGPFEDESFPPYWFSPDGSLLAYLANEGPTRGGTLDLYTIATGATVQVALPSGG